MKRGIYLLCFSLTVLASCSSNDSDYKAIADPYAGIKAAFGNNIDPDNLYNYAAQTIPAYIIKDNSAGNAITDAGATLGRVLFYDKNLSVDNSVACASCHIQEHAFSDGDLTSTGVAGNTARHAMRLINTRFAGETHFFWNERAETLEQQTTMPVQDHAEMGYSGENGDPSVNDLITKLSQIEYYKELFTMAFGSDEITENKMQLALAQFVRSIQSFDSKYDTGRAMVANDGQPFPNFTQQENQGKNLFLAPPQFNVQGVRTGGGVGCAGCHQAPEFDILPTSLNNGVTGTIGSTDIDAGNTRAPSLRDLVKTDGTSNGPFMHTGEFTTLEQVLNHYNSISPEGNDNLDPKLNPTGNGVQLNLTNTEIEALTAFLKTLSGSDVYTNPKWSDPFLQ